MSAKYSLKFSENIKLILIQSGTYTTSHGIQNIFKSKHWSLKIMWSILSMTSCIFAVYLIIHTVGLFLKNEIVTQIDVVKESPTEFPSVSFCNINLFQSDLAQSLIKNISKTFKDDLKKFSAGGFIVAQNKRQDFLQNNILLNRSESEIRLLSPQLNETLIDCSISGKYCNETEFDWFYDGSYGNCYRFNSGKNLTDSNLHIHYSSEAGKISGLKLWLYIGNDSHETIPNSGLHIFINNRTYTPVSVEGIDVSAGKETNIIVEKIFSKKLPSRSSNCLEGLNSVDSFKSELYKATFKLNTIYRQKNCLDLCKQKYIIEKCICHLPNHDNFGSNSACSSKKDIDCVTNILREFANEITLPKYCAPDCPKECESIAYSMSLSHSDFPSYSFYKELLESQVLKKHFPNGTDYLTLKNSIASINVYYQDLSYTKITELEKMTTISFISSIGGILGLCLGISFLSLFELIDIFIRIVCDFIESYKIRNA